MAAQCTMTLTLCMIISWSRDGAIFFVLSHFAMSSLLPCPDSTDAHHPPLGARGLLPQKWRPLPRICAYSLPIVQNIKDKWSVSWRNFPEAVFRVRKWSRRNDRDQMIYCRFSYRILSVFMNKSRHEDSTNQKDVHCLSSLPTLSMARCCCKELREFVLKQKGRCHGRSKFSFLRWKDFHCPAVYDPFQY
jgi:hypothetical protein